MAVSDQRKNTVRDINQRTIKLGPEGPEVALQEIREVLEDEGYSADQRKGWLKQVLTDLTRESSENHSPDREELVAEVKKIIDEDQNGKPISDDVL